MKRWNENPRSYLWRFCQAEILKIFAFRWVKVLYLVTFPLVSLMIPMWCHSWNLKDHPFRNAFEAFPSLLWETWPSSWLIAITLSVYLLAIENQYGMIRITCSQPLTRLDYLAGKYLAVSAHVVMLGSAYLSSHLVWGILLVGLRGANWVALLHFFICCGVALLFLLSLAWIALAMGLYRKTLATAISTAWLTFLLGLLVLSLSHELKPYIVFMYWPMPMSFLFAQDPILVQILKGLTPSGFIVVALATLLLLGLPAAIYFTERDITE
jgi:ABC-type transport system involved in multi-copper enzyme maturation permease subunit